MDDQEIHRLVTSKIFGQPQFSNYKMTPAAFELYREELEDLPISYEQGWAAVRAMLREDNTRLPNPQSIRRRIFQEMGVLAPSWSEALAAITEEAKVGHLANSGKLPGPVGEALKANGGFFDLRNSGNSTALIAQIRETYREMAVKHDLFVMEPGGLDRFYEVCQVIEWRKAHRALWERARDAKVLIPPAPGGVDRTPSLEQSDEELQMVIDEAEMLFGPLDQLDEKDPPRHRRELDELLRRIERGWSKP